jgi:cytochrome c5
VKNFIRHILSQKKYIAILIALAVGALAFAIYMVINVQQNLKLMAAAPSVEYFPDYPSVNTQGKDPTVIQRGEYLAKAGDCIACHTNTIKKGKQFAGGLPMVTPFGTIYTPNITPDPETGIGKWTDAQFIKAMREGISPQGHYYYPAFPFYYFSKVTDEDLKALKAYLDSIPAVKEQNHENAMLFPFNIRLLQLGWRILFWHGEATQVFTPNPHQSEKNNRGAYLVDGLGHCAMCHTPSYYLLSDQLPLAAPIKKYDLTGAKVNGYLAPNITKSNIGNTPDAEVMQVFTEDRLIGGGKVEGPMKEVNHNSLKYLSADDLLAIVNYLKNKESEQPPKPKAGSGGIGKAIYEGYCSGCHENGAGGAPKYGDTSAWDAVMKKGVEKVDDNAIHGFNSMPAKGTCLSCSDDEIKQAVDYMIKSTQGDEAQASFAAPPAKKLTREDGKRIYQENCSVCHNNGFKGAQKPGDMQAWKKIIDAGFYATYKNVVTGQNGHIPNGACPTCNDAELKAAIKYMMQESTTDHDYDLW